MNIDQKIIDRFDELIGRGTAIHTDALSGQLKFTIRDRKAGWRVSVLTLLVSVFGEDSVHVSEFRKLGGGHDNSLYVEVLRASKKRSEKSFFG